MAEFKVGSGSVELKTNSLELSLTSLVMKEKSSTTALLPESSTRVMGSLLALLALFLFNTIVEEDATLLALLMFFLVLLLLLLILLAERLDTGVAFPVPPSTNKFLAAPRASSSEDTRMELVETAALRMEVGGGKRCCWFCFNLRLPVLKLRC